MYIIEKTLDDLLHRVISKLLGTNDRIDATHGAGTEMRGILLHLSDPRARLSRTEQKQHVFSSLGELLWYLSGRNDLQFITYYIPRYSEESDDGQTVHGGYGPRLFKMGGTHNQIQNVIDLLKQRPGSRRAVIQLFDAGDIATHHKEIPCTCTLQFMIRKQRLHMLTYMRSNDAFIGLPHDVFAFTMLQEIIARAVGVDLGTYKHAVGSLHLYDRNRNGAEAYLREGFQQRVSMPPMPTGDPWRSISVLHVTEVHIRDGVQVQSAALGIAPYWQDLVRLLQIFWHFKNGQRREITKLKKAMASDVFAPYIEQKRRTAKPRLQAEVKGQLHLQF